MQPSHLKGMEFFGPAKWTSIHSTCAAYTPDNCEKIKEWIKLEFELLPCKTCRTHALQMLKDIPMDPYLANNHDLFFWSYLIHDAVNKRLNKKSPPYNQIKQYYFNALNTECAVCNS
jgi:hypothetical protein